MQGQSALSSALLTATLLATTLLAAALLLALALLAFTFLSLAIALFGLPVALDRRTYPVRLDYVVFP
jgi:hypothetical protein